MRPREVVDLPPPVAYFGGKRHMADEVWARLGDPRIYVEPFAGMLGVLLNRPSPPKLEVIVDADALVCNFWRALVQDYEGLLAATRLPVNHHDMIARKRYCYNWREDNVSKICHDPHYYDIEVAGWWAWGVNNTIKTAFVATKPPDGDRIGSRPGWQACGIHAISITDAEARAWLKRLSGRMRHVKVFGGSWDSALSKGVFAREREDRIAIFLDPPYRTDERSGGLYSSDDFGTSDDAAEQAYAWAVEHGDRYRIVYCCAAGDFPCPEGWTEIGCRFRVGFIRMDRAESYRDVAFFSPTCLQPSAELLL